MTSYDELDLGTRILPGVDLTLWLQLILAIVAAAVVGGVAITVT